ncbi:DUF333 domain-containing protein [Candidatus Kuenenbacteria bacterium]|nr:DUF333 domain-containing protein [Candidatus Kuenenbacteria bacterium]
MFKKYLLAFLFFCVLAGVLFVIRGNEDGWLCVNGVWVKHGNPEAPMPTSVCGESINTNENNPVGLANPASKNCLDQGGQLTIKKDETGGEYGVCTLKDGSECEEWALFRRECQPGIKVITPQKDTTVQSPLTITGEARGTWFFEASFPVKLVDEFDNILATGVATADPPAGGDWMTEDYVPFKAELSFPLAITDKGYLLLNKDNPSGLPGNDLQLKVPVVLLKGETEKVKVFFNNNNLDPEISCQKVFPIEREILKTPAVAEAAIKELLKGPSQAEKDNGYFSNIPEGVKIQKLTIEKGVAKVDFDKTLESAAGGSCRVSAVRAEITETLLQFSTVKSVVISIDGRSEDILQP